MPFTEFIKNTECTETLLVISLCVLLPCPEYSVKAQQTATKSFKHLMELILTLNTIDKNSFPRHLALRPSQVKDRETATKHRLDFPFPWTSLDIE